MTRGEGVQNPEILADVICARPPRTSRQKPETPKNEVLGLIETPMSSNMGHTNESQEGTLVAIWAIQMKATGEH